LTDAELEGFARQALNASITEWRNTKKFNFYFGQVIPGEGLVRMGRIESTIIERLGEDWLNHGSTKDIGFGLLRISTVMFQPLALAFVSVCNMFKPTAAFEKLPPKRQQQIAEGGADKCHEAVKRGLLELDEGFSAIVQTPERVYMAHRIIGQESITSQCGSQADYGGRTKLYVSPDEAVALLDQLSKQHGLRPKRGAPE
jgi:hypothetical protein